MKPSDYRFVSIVSMRLARARCSVAIASNKSVDMWQSRGSIDHIAAVTARMKGWKTRTFTDKLCLHHREMGAAHHGVLTARFKNPRQRLCFRESPGLGVVANRESDMTQPPFVHRRCGIALRLILGPRSDASKRPVSPELVAFHRGEQMRRLKNFLTRKRGLSAERLQHPT